MDTAPDESSSEGFTWSDYRDPAKDAIGSSNTSDAEVHQCPEGYERPDTPAGQPPATCYATDSIQDASDAETVSIVTTSSSGEYGPAMTDAICRLKLHTDGPRFRWCPRRARFVLVESR